MNTFKFLLYNGTDFVDISNIVETNANLQDKLDLTLDFANFTIKHAKANYTEYPNIDFSKPIKPWTPFMLVINDTETYRFYTSDSTRSIIGKGTTKRYKHEIGVIEASKSLYKKPIPDMTITQPKSVIFDGKYFSDSKNSNTNVKNTLVNLPLTVINESNNTSYISGTTIKAGVIADIYVTVDMINRQYTAAKRAFVDQYTRSAQADVELRFYANGVELESERRSLYIDGGTSKVAGFWPINYVTLKEAANKKYSFNFKRTTAVDEIITVKARTLGEYVKCTESIVDGGCSTFEDEIDTTVLLTLSTLKDENNTTLRFMNDEVKKIIDSVNLMHGTSFYLDSTTEAKISNVLAPEYTFQSYTAWDALEKLANYVNAIPEVGLNNYSEISFTFLDEEPDLEYDIETFTDESQTYLFDDYNSGYEINASNVIEEDSLHNAKVEPYVGGWMSVRTDSVDVSQLTEDNATFKTRQNIYRIYKLLIKGIQVRITDGTTPITLSGNIGGTTYLNHTQWDLSDSVIETQRWNALENGTRNVSDGQRLSTDTKGNHIKYTQGTKYISGLNYKTDTLSDLIGTTQAPRALMETIMRAAAQFIQDQNTLGNLVGYNVVTATNSNPEKAIEDASGTHKLFRGILAQIHYAPLANIRSTVYKYNTFNLGVDNIQYSNEQDKVNDTLNLGEYTRKTINKLGNILYSVSGRSKDFSTIPKLGYRTTDGKYIVSRSLNLNKNLITYDMELSENFINQSSYVGVNSAYRQYEVPATEIVHRQDKYNEFIILTKDRIPLLPSTSYFTQNGKRMILDAIYTFDINQNEYPISYGRMEITKELGSSQTDNVKAFDMPINGVSLGTTINLQLEMDDNYSVGPRIDDAYNIETGIVKDDKTLQNYAKYVDDFGRFYSYNLKLRQRGTVNNSEADAKQYPFNLNDTYHSDDGILFELDRINVNKDAREKYGLNIQLPILSDDINNIRVYPGFAKYNSTIRDKDHRELGFAFLKDSNYFPGINDTKVDTTKVSITSGYTATPQYDTTNGIYGVIFEPYMDANLTVYGYVVYEKTTGELMLAVREEFENTDDFGIYHQFTPIYAVHKRSLNTYMYPDNPIQCTVTFNEMSGTNVEDQLVYAGNRATQPSISRAGYELDGWFTHISLLEQYRFDFNTSINSNITLYAKWNALPVGSHKWVRVYTTNKNVTIWPETGTYTCPTSYDSFLPDADIYSLDYTIEVIPYRQCNNTTDICYENPITMQSFNVCEARYYKVVEST